MILLDQHLVIPFVPAQGIVHACEAFRLADPGKGMLPRIAQQCFDLLQDFLVTTRPKVEIFSAVEGEFDGQRQSIDLSISFPAFASAIDLRKRFAFSSLLIRCSVS